MNNENENKNLCIKRTIRLPKRINLFLDTMKKETGLAKAAYIRKLIVDDMKKNGYEN